MLLRTAPNLHAAGIIEPAAYASRRTARAGMDLGAVALLGRAGAARADDLPCKSGAPIPQEPATNRDAITACNNDHEFGNGKSDPEARAGKLKTQPWSGPRRCRASAAPSWIGPMSRA